MRTLVILFLMMNLTTISIAQNKRLKKSILPLSENSYQIIEKKGKDTIIIGTLNSINPEVKNGDFKFFDKEGALLVTGRYMENYPSGTWNYYDKDGKIIDQINYGKLIEFINSDTIKPEEVFFVVDNMPRFQGGSQDKFRLYIQENLVYPIYAVKRNAQGRVFIQFTVNEQGKVCDVSVVRGVEDIDLNFEAMRVVSESPAWEPGTQRGEKKAIRFVFPVVFQLQ